jgi:outer membrane protein OmpA-like peptidoglycan-associated protein
VGYTYVPRTEPEPGDRDGDGIRDDEDQCPDDAEDFDEFEDVDGCPDPDNDHDGILDANDQCPLQPEDIDGDDDDDGCPDAEPGDRDGDGILDDADQCPDDPEDRDEFEDENGCPDPDNDQDGVLDVDDQCPTEAEDRDQFEDENGCPDPDNDQDTVPDATDQCPIAPGRPEDNGCPRTIRVEGEQIVILQRIEFATDSDRLLPRSLPILEEVRAVLAANPQLGRIRIEGHTDSQGGDAHNLDLSRRRAETVKRWLVDHGIGEARLTAEGFGETRAIADNATPAGRQQNRRVEFHILH